MKSSRNNRMSALMTMLSGLILAVLTVPAYAQQEVSPDWFDPWVAPNTAVAQAAKPAAPKTVRSTKAAALASGKSVQRVRRAEKLRAKKATTRPTAS